MILPRLLARASHFTAPLAQERFRGHRLKSSGYNTVTLLKIAYTT